MRHENISYLIIDVCEYFSKSNYFSSGTKAILLPF